MLNKKRLLRYVHCLFVLLLTAVFTACAPAFDLLHNLNRQMGGATPLAEVAFLLDDYWGGGWGAGNGR